MASATGFKATIALLDMLTTPAGVQGHCGGLGWASAISPHRSGSDRSILSEVNHRLESRMRDIHPSGLEGGGRTTASPYPYIQDMITRILVTKH